MDFEHKSAECVFLRVYAAFLSLDRAWRRGYFHEAVEQLLDTESVERRAEENGGELAGEVFVDIKVGIDSID